MLSKSLLKILIVLLSASILSCEKADNIQIAKDASSLEQFSQNYQRLVKDYQQKLKANPKDLSLRLKIANFYYRFNDHSKVEEILKGIESEEAKVILAKAYTKAKDYIQAIEIFEHLSIEDKDQEYLYFYGKVLEKKNLFPQALKIYAKVKAPFDNQARERIDFIKSKEEVGIPPEISDITAQAASFIESLKDDAAVILLVDEETKMLDDNTSVSSIHVIEKVLKERGKKLAEVDVGYDSTYQKVEMDFARTITKDGKVIYTGGENIRDVGRYLNYPLYSNARAFIVSMPAVDVGSIIEYKINVYSAKLINKDNFSFIYRLREKFPIFKAKFRLTAPKAKEVNFKYYNKDYAGNIDLKPEFKTAGNENIYTWEFSKIKPIIPEYNMPSTSLINPAFLVSSFTSWDEVYKWWKSLYQDKLALDAQAKEFVKELISEAKDDYRKARNIYEYVSKDIRYVAIEYGDGGYEPHHAQEVLNNRYGDCKDQAMLLIAMLREAGLEAYPVLIPTRSAYSISKDFAAVNFNHAIAAVKLKGSLIFMDPTSNTTPFERTPLSDQERTVMVFFDDTYKITEIAHNRDNYVKYEMDITLSRQEDALIKRQVETKGFFASGYRYYLKYTHPAIIKEDIQQKMMQISSLSKLDDYSFENVDDYDHAPKLTYSFKTEKFLNPARNLRIVPVLDQINLDYNLIGKEERSFPIDFDGINTESAKIKIHLPSNLKVKFLPESKTFENKWFKLTVSYSDKGDYVDFYEELVTKERFVDQKEYLEFKKHLKEAIYFLREEIILESIK